MSLQDFPGFCLLPTEEYQQNTPAMSPNSEITLEVTTIFLFPFLIAYVS